ncbi:MAG: hypothetical protein HQ542_00825 [Bacteroidia bacterium]|nr:hypothetical protein [Bacteroidia bacterium]
MITKQDKQGLDLALKIFDHFTHGGLQLAREIIILELQLEGEPDRNSLPLKQPKNNDEIVFPISDITPDELGLPTDVENAQPFDRERTISSEEDNLPF